MMKPTKYRHRDDLGALTVDLTGIWNRDLLNNPLVRATSLRQSAVHKAINDLVAKIDPAVFKQTFGAGVDQLNQLVNAHTVTIAKLMEIAPAGTVDPTTNLYNNTMYLMAVLLAIALVCNATMKPVHPRHHLSEEELSHEV